MREFKKAYSPGDCDLPVRPGRFSLLFQDARSARVDAPPEDAFVPIRRIGGDTGWYYANWLWRVRGWMDLMIGGIGLRRGRRDPDDVRVGDTIDCWRVRTFEPGRRLLLALELIYPGHGFLEFEVVANGSGSIIRQTATYATGGFWGCLYWYSTYPAHNWLFGGMLRGIGAGIGPRAEVRKQVCEER